MVFDSYKKRIRLSQNYLKNYFEADNITYEALPLDVGDEKKGIGLNSSVFRVQREDEPSATLVLKVCAYSEEVTADNLKERRARFFREIEAMKLAQKNGKSSVVVNIKHSSTITMESGKQHTCFLMEAADCTLADYLGKQLEITFQQKLLLCFDLLRAITALHDIGVYHRDIKPENIFLFDQKLKIGDLGLVAYRGDDAELDSREKIGPPKWMSPEAFNKAYCLHRPENDFIDRIIDDRSDVYQLGKVCWYILQGDIPNGCLKCKDLVNGGTDLYGTFLKPMLRYQRSERPQLGHLQQALQPLLRKHSG